MIILWIYLQIKQGYENGSIHWKCQNLLLVLLVLLVEGPSLYYLGVASNYTSGFPSKFFFFDINLEYKHFFAFLEGWYIAWLILTILQFALTWLLK